MERVSNFDMSEARGTYCKHTAVPHCLLLLLHPEQTLLLEWKESNLEPSRLSSFLRNRDWYRALKVPPNVLKLRVMITESDGVLFSLEE